MAERLYDDEASVAAVLGRFLKEAGKWAALDPKLGEIAFVGAIDAAALAAAHEAGPGDSRVVMTGTLRIGEAAFENARFNYFMGD